MRENHGFTLVETLVGLTIIAVLAVGAYTVWQRPVSEPITTSTLVFSSKEKCEQQTHKACGFQNCDYIPKGKTFEEVCGENFKKGWVPLHSPTSTPLANPSIEANIPNDWKVFNDEQYTFKFQYPPLWSIKNLPNTTRTIIINDNQKNKLVTIDTRVDFSVIGISYCGAYPEDQRCETIKTRDRRPVSIDWGAENTATAMISAPDGTYGVSFTLHQSTEEAKMLFRKILSTFQFFDKKQTFTTPLLTHDPTAGVAWQLYKSGTGKFEIKYPQGWFIYDRKQWEYDNRDVGCKGSFTRKVYNEKGQLRDVEALVLSRLALGECIGYGREWSQWPGDFTIRIFPSERPLFELGEKQPYQIIKIDGERAVKYPFIEESALPRKKATQVYINHNAKGYVIEFVQTDKQGHYDPLFNQILSTFQFTQ